MTRAISPSTLLCLGALALTACADDAPPGPNPARLWLALDGSEVQVRLIPVEPPIF